MKKEKQYEAIEKMMERVREAFGAEHKIARMFEKCISQYIGYNY